MANTLSRALSLNLSLAASGAFGVDPGVVAVAVVPAAVTFVGATGDDVNATNFTFSGHAIGTATADRKVVVCVMSSGVAANTITGVTIAGNAMTENIKPTIDGENQCAIYEREVSSGTTADIIVSHSSGKGFCAISVFAVTGAALTVTTTASTTADLTPNTTINVSENGVLVTCSLGVSGSNPTSATWSGVTERSDASLDSSTAIATSASDAISTTESDKAVSVAYNATPGDATMALCAWDIVYTGPVATIEYIEEEQQTGNTSPYTFSGKAIGAAATNRTVIVTISGQSDGGVVTGVTIGGITATETATSQASATYSHIYEADVPTGTTADVVVTVAGSPNRCGIGVWKAYGIGASDASFDNDMAEPLSQSLTISNGGVAVATSMNDHASATATWGAGMAERFEGTMESTRHSAADTSGGGTRTVAVTWTAEGSTASLCAAAWPVG